MGGAAKKVEIFGSDTSGNDMDFPILFKVNECRFGKPIFIRICQLDAN